MTIKTSAKQPTGRAPRPRKEPELVVTERFLGLISFEEFQLRAAEILLGDNLARLGLRLEKKMPPRI